MASTKSTKTKQFFLFVYPNTAYDISNPKYYKSCDFNRPAPANQTCGIDVARYDPCSARNNFGLKDGIPCVFLKFDADTEFAPEFYKATELPENMPDDLEQTIVSNLKANPKNEVIKMREF